MTAETSDSKISSPHDRLFKQIWSNRESARDLLGNCLPEPMRELVDLDTLEIRKDGFVDGRLKEFHSDLLYKASFGKQANYVHLLFEHKSHPEKTIGLQLHACIGRLWRMHSYCSTSLPIHRRSNNGEVLCRGGCCF